ncbi:related to metaphase-anaphase transition protein (Mlo2) [Ramularia collo-cygni]|uniref:Related to metaphase-anaphase transition protein (Mlo2) n=1 Tax=Ramularia collo-cygni TaxID=112498 RepID=A0A2D3UZD6_9PEZI|nr:related to metaphase-anaphase transition protein (Mlo2) [Ramularia collo-cygni]CZT14569.1 related to metaphase-anaphase transition protein (Mlo2) [Ramularia collo-cygni]
MASDEQQVPPNRSVKRASSITAASESSQTAREYIASQLSLEAEAKEALPYQFDTCTHPLGPLRQTVYACLTCSPPPASIHQQSTPAGVCYSCSISCHGEHNLVELFAKRNFVCDCGTTRLANTGTPCSLRINSSTGRKGHVTGEEAHAGNKYNHNYAGKFCGCGEEYDPELEKGTMFQCLGLGSVEDGGCGEDWWHPECLMGRERVKQEPKKEGRVEDDGQLETVKEEAEDGEDAPAPNGVDGEHAEVDDAPLPPGFPAEDDFDHLICYKCVSANPWIKQYAGTNGFLPAVAADGSAPTTNSHAADGSAPTTNGHTANGHATNGATEAPTGTGTADSKKRKADDDQEVVQDSLKKVKSEDDIQASEPTATAATTESPRHASLPLASAGPITLFLQEDFRDHLCRCPTCFPRLARHPQLLEEEDTYEPPVSEDGENADGARSVGSGSLLDRGEAALSSMDRVRAIEGAMAYNHLKDKLKPFLQQYADSGEAVGAEHINAFFAKLRGDEQAIREAAAGANQA